MSFLDKARQAAEQARQSAGERLAQPTSPESQAQMRKTAGEAGGQLRSAAGQARKGVVTVVERIESTQLLEEVPTADVELVSLAGETDATQEIGRPQIEG